MGAGGAGGAIAIELLRAGVSDLAIHDVDESRVAALIELLSGVGDGTVRASSDPRGRDLVLNASSLGMSDDDPLPLDAERLESTMFVGDVIAGHGVTPFIAAARDAGCRTATGDDMVDAVQDVMADFLLGAAEDSSDESPRRSGGQRSRSGHSS